MTDEPKWPPPRDDPHTEPAEPWARPNAWVPDWEKIRKELRRVADAEANAQS